MHTPCDSAS